MGASFLMGAAAAIEARAEPSAILIIFEGAVEREKNAGWQYGKALGWLSVAAGDH